jgi:hypothetical protein
MEAAYTSETSATLPPSTRFKDVIFTFHFNVVRILTHIYEYGLDGSDMQHEQGKQCVMKPQQIGVYEDLCGNGRLTWNITEVE